MNRINRIDGVDGVLEAKASFDALILEVKCRLGNSGLVITGLKLVLFLRHELRGLEKLGSGHGVLVVVVSEFLVWLLLVSLSCR